MSLLFFFQGKVFSCEDLQMNSNVLNYSNVIVENVVSWLDCCSQCLNITLCSSFSYENNSFKCYLRNLNEQFINTTDV